MFCGSFSRCRDGWLVSSPWRALICSYIRRLGDFWGFKISNFNVFFFFFFFFLGGGGAGGGGGFRKIKKIPGCEHFVDIFLRGGHHKIGPNLRLSSIYFSVFCKLNVQNGDIFCGQSDYRRIPQHTTGYHRIPQDNLCYNLYHFNL